jgi:hypothetical protein
MRHELPIKALDRFKYTCRPIPAPVRLPHCGLSAPNILVSPCTSAVHWPGVFAGVDHLASKVPCEYTGTPTIPPRSGTRGKPFALPRTRSCSSGLRGIYHRKYRRELDFKHK